MTIQEAYKILGLAPGTKDQEIKKRYRQLMRQVHPDVLANQEKSYPYNAHQITAAYSILRQNPGDDPLFDSCTPKQKNTGAARDISWDATVNDRAFCSRRIFHNVHNDDGEVMGNFCIAQGKYMWTPEEDFSLFLLSIYQCGSQLLDQIDQTFSKGGLSFDPNPAHSFQAEKRQKLRHQVLAHLCYLLAQQFMDASSLLKTLAREISTQNNSNDGSRIFYIPAMVEFNRPSRELAQNQALYPSAIRRHRLYLKNGSGQEVGYLSFSDDRMYYIVVPLFEQRSVSVKIRAVISKSSPQPGTVAETIKAHAAPSSQKLIRYQKLHLWIRLIPSAYGQMPESLELQIQNLLKGYRERVS